MSDFDFDEIDKAVNGALGSDSSDEPRGSLVSSRDEPSVQAAPSMPAARRASSGRFMDMVHPSSDMRRENGESTPMSARPNSPEPSRLPEPPVLFQTPETAAVQPVDTPTADTSLGDYETTSEWSTPLESPFLPGAKVEKRPLGGSAESVPVSAYDSLFDEPKDELLEAPEEELKLEAPDDPLLEATTFPDPIDFSESMQATQADSVENTFVETPIETPAEPTSPVEPVPQEPVFQQPVTVEEEPSGPTSITQQYKEQPAATQESGAIYDTESYHQPLAAPAKKHSSAWVIMWVLLLVLLGAGAGVAFYFYILPLI